MHQLGDFGLSRKQGNESVLVSENKVVGTIGYLAPEYTERGRLSTKSDVYSFGVVLLELMTGRTTMDKNLENKGLVGWVRKYVIVFYLCIYILPSIMCFLLCRQDHFCKRGTTLN